MEILGIGPLELVVIIIILLVVLGPNDMAKAGRTLGKFFRKIMMSDTWKAITMTSKSIRDLPNTLARQAGMEEFEKMKTDLEKDVKSISDDLPDSNAIGQIKTDIEKDIQKVTDTSADTSTSKDDQLDNKEE